MLIHIVQIVLLGNKIGLNQSHWKVYIFDNDKLVHGWLFDADACFDHLAISINDCGF